MIRHHPELDCRTPVLVGVGLQSQRVAEPLDADEPLSLMRRASAAAAHDAGAPKVLREIDRVYVPKGRWRYRDPGRAIATSFGSLNVTSLLARVGVLQESLIADACNKIIGGSADVCLVVGGEAGFRLLCATKLGYELHDEQQDTEPDVTWRADSPITLAAEIAAGLGEGAVSCYAMIAAAARAASGRSISEDVAATAALYSELSEIAARNPYAWKRLPVTAEAVTSDSASNPMLAFPYRSEHVSRWSVDQASALIFTSVEKARELQIDPSRWVYPVSSGISNAMVPLSQRVSVGEAPGAQQAVSAALEHAGVTAHSLDLLELYSCFPIALQLHAAALGVPSANPAPSFTGGMRYAGGPFNNFVLHTTAQLALALRQTGRTGLISSVSGVLTKHAFSLWSAAPAQNPFRSIDVSEAVLSLSPPRELAEDYAGVASIVGYTVLAGRRDRPARAVAVAETPDGRRVIVWSEGNFVVQAMTTEEFCGRLVFVAGDGTFDVVENPAAVEAK
jgi:acetyl-CoA C-acetyltransferase